MRSLTRPIGLLVTSLFLTLIFCNPALAFECTNAGVGFTAPDDGGGATHTACGDGAVASNGDSTALGGDATASGFDSTALGRSATASQTNSTAVGRGTLASAEHSTALGESSTASAFRGTALGWSAEASGASSTTVGSLSTASASFSTALGNSATASGTRSTAVSDLATASGENGTAIGQLAEASGLGSTALGHNATASGSHSTALGRSAEASGTGTTTLGYLSKALSPHFNATALGYLAQVEQSNAMVLGSTPDINFGTDYVDVGIGTTMPQAPLHIRREDDTFEFLFLESDLAGGPQDRPMMQLTNNGGIRFQFDNVSLGTAWRFQAATGNQDNFEITKVGTGQLELVLQDDGDLIITGALTQNSDVNAKRNIEAVDGQMLLAKLDTLPVSEWTYKRDTSGARHLGPMAQDFHAAFGLGEDQTKIAPGDMAGVNMAAIKAQQAQIKAQQQTIVGLQKANAAKLAELDEVKYRLAKLESLIKGLNKPTVGL